MSKPVKMSNAQRRQFVLDKNTPFAVTEAYKTARTNLMFTVSTSKKKAVVFTSCNPGEGKTTTCVNMAITLSEMGAKILLIDADMRKPMVHNLLAVGNKTGLSSVLGGFCSLGEALSNNEKWPNLDIMSAGPIPPNPAELLSSQNMANMISVLCEHYDYILIDTPPVNVVTDSQLMNDIIVGIVFVVKENYTTHPSLQDAIRSIQLTNGKILGFIKVNCNSKGSKHYKSYKYKYQYNYKYSSESSEK